MRSLSNSIHASASFKCRVCAATNCAGTRSRSTRPRRTLFAASHLQQRARVLHNGDDTIYEAMGVVPGSNMAPYSETTADASNRIRVLLQALRCQLEADEDYEHEASGNAGVRELTELPASTLLRRLLQVLQSCSSQTGACAADAATAFQQQQGWQTLLALLTTTTTAAAATSPTDLYLAAAVAELLEWVVQHAKGWPAFVPWRLVQLAAGQASTAETLQVGWRVLAAAACNKDLLHTLHTKPAPSTSRPTAAAAPAAGRQSNDCSTHTGKQSSSAAAAAGRDGEGVGFAGCSSTAGTQADSDSNHPVASACVGSGGCRGGGSGTGISSSNTSCGGTSSGGGRGGSTCLSQLLEALDQEAYRLCLTPEVVQHVTLLVLRCTECDMAAAWSCHPAQLLLQLHASLISPQDLPPGCHCPAAAAAAGARGEAQGGADGQTGSGGGSMMQPAGVWTDKGAAGCGACDAALQLLLAARLVVSWSTAAAAQPSGTATAANTTSSSNHSSSRCAQGQAGGNLDLLGLTKGVVNLVKELSRAAPRRLAAKITWEGITSSYEQQPAAADPCAPINTCSTTWQALLLLCGQTSGLTGGKRQLAELEAPVTHLQAALQLLVTCCQALAPAQKKSLYMTTDICGLLESLSDFVTPCALVLTQQLYGCLCQGFAGLRQEVLTAGSTPGLCGMVCCSTAPGVWLAALEKLPQVLDSCSGQQFLRLCQPGGVLSWVTQLLAGKQSAGAGMAAKCAGSSSGAGSQGASAEDQLEMLDVRRSSNQSSNQRSSGSSSDGVIVEKASQMAMSLVTPTDGLLMDQLLRAAAQVYCSLLDRARRMRPDGSTSVTTLHLPSHQVPGTAGAAVTTAGSTGGITGAAGRMGHATVAVSVPRWGSWRQLAPTEILALEAAALRVLRAALSPLNAAAEDQENQLGQVAAGSGVHSSPPAAAGVAARAQNGQQHQQRQQEQRAGHGRLTQSRRAVKEARCLPAGKAAGAAAGSTFDEDGLRVVWDSGPSGAVRGVRSAWAALPLRERISWRQTLQDVEVCLTLPPGTTKRDLAVNVQRDRLTIKLTWCGRVVDGPLHRPVAYSSSCWSLDTAPMPKTTSNPVRSSCSTMEASQGSAKQRTRQQQQQQQSDGNWTKQAAGGASKEVAWSELLLVLPKEEPGHYWKALFEGGEEKSYWEILTEAVQCEEDAASAPSLDQLGPEAAVLWEDLQERAAMVACGDLDLEHGFDDFRIVIGDNTL